MRFSIIFGEQNVFATDLPHLCCVNVSLVPVAGFCFSLCDGAIVFLPVIISGLFSLKYIYIYIWNAALTSISLSPAQLLDTSPLFFCKTGFLI